MLWTIRWTDLQAQEDRWVVLEASSRAAAEGWGLKRGIPVVSLAEATTAESTQAKRAGLLRRYTAEPKHLCCGRAVGAWQLATIMACGVATAALHLRAYAAAVRAWF
jgi:hypothetical protein